MKKSVQKSLQSESVNLKHRNSAVEHSETWLGHNARGTDLVLFIDRTIWMNYEAYTSHGLDIACGGAAKKKNMLLKQKAFLNVIIRLDI